MMFRLLLFIFIAVCAAKPAFVPRFGITNPLGGISLSSSSSSSAAASSTSSAAPVSTGLTSTSTVGTTTTGSTTPSTVYEIFALGGGSCKQGFIGQVNTPACWSSTCGIWNTLKIRQLYNATITMFSTSACTGDAEKIYPVTSASNIEQDCLFTTSEFQSFRVIPGAVNLTNADPTTVNNICLGGLSQINCATSSCLGTVLT